MVHLPSFDAGPPEQILLIDDPETGLKGTIVVHSTARGPAAGGCRLMRYADESAMTGDALRLALGMTYKNAMADLPLGGGKAVLNLPARQFDRKKLFQAFGRAVAKLEGRYITAEDVGTNVEDMVAVRSSTAHVAGLSGIEGRPSGDPSPWTAQGVFLAMQVAAQRRLGRSLDGLNVAVQGLGNVGFRLSELLNGAGARLLVADPRDELCSKAAALFGASVINVNSILEAKADIFAPCALGAILSRVTIPKLKAKIVCGGANNQLATAEDGDRLAAADVLYAPDYVVNAGGIINVAAEYLNWSSAEVTDRVSQIGNRLDDLFCRAETAGIPSHRAADTLARELIGRRNEILRATVADRCSSSVGRDNPGLN